MANRIFLVLAFLATTLIACSGDDDTPPTFRVRNDRATDASMQVKTSGGNTININNVKPGVTTAYQGVAPGQVDITVDIQGESGQYTASFVAAANQSFTVVVANTTPPTISVVSP